MPRPLSDRLRGLYLITDDKLMPDPRFADIAEQALRGGAALIQYRNKSGTAGRFDQAERLRRLCEKYDALLIINDDLELARAVGAHGIHLGVDDTPYEQARALLGDSAVIGVSCYADLERARQFDRLGANYVAFGAFHASPTKPHAAKAGPELLARARGELAAPLCAIGGIDEYNAPALVEAGADMVAVISGLLTARDITASAARIASLF